MSNLLFVLLLLAWLVDSVIIFYLLHTLTLVDKLQMRPPAAVVLIVMTGLMLALIAGGASLRSAGHSVLAVLLSGSPTIFLLGPYTLIILLILAVRPRR
jgi:hypothetical protein